jgi:uncharacterized protein (DUF58 family)
MTDRNKAIISEFLDPDLLSALPSLEMRARYLVSGFLTGLHRSPYRGSSVEFKEFRDYQPGDELKIIDWKLFARTDRLHVKLREEQTNMNAYLLLDRSASMNFAGPDAKMTKWRYACSLAAALLLFLHRQNDAFSLNMVSKGMEDFVRPGSKTALFQRFLKELHREADAAECDWDQALNELSNVVRQRSIVILISDFYTDPELFHKHLDHLRFLKCEPLFIQILDPIECDFNYDDPLLLQDLESGEKLVMSPDLLRTRYKEKMEKHINDLADLVKQNGGDHLLLRTDSSPLKVLAAYLAARSGRFK